MTTLYINYLGDPVIKNDGSLAKISGAREIKQRVRNVFLTPFGSDPWMPDYGFDIFTASRAGYNEGVMKALAVQALNPEYIYGVSSVNYVSVRNATGTAGITSYINFSLNLDDGGTYEDTYEVELEE